MMFGDLLRQKKDAADLSEAKLAKASGVALGALHSYLLPTDSDGHRKPSFSNVVKLAKALGVTCETFAGCDDIAGLVESEPAKRKTPTKKAAPKKPKES